jgi:hypothetical protein
MTEHKQIGTTGFSPGWHENIAMGLYLGDPAVSASRLWTLHETTPAHLDAALQTAAVRTDPQELGEIAHTAVLEPAAFDGRYVVLGQCEAIKKGDGERCSNPGSYYRDGHSYCGVKGHDPLGGRPNDSRFCPVAQADKDCALRVRGSLLDHPTARWMVASEGPREVVGVWRDPKTGLFLKIRPDALIEEPKATPAIYHWACVNLKTTGKPAGPTRYPRDAERSGLYFKAAFYRLVLRELWGLEPQHFFYPTVETFGRCETIVYRLNEESLDIGEAEVLQALGKLALCVHENFWPGYSLAVHDLSLSDWRLKLARDLDFVEAA